MRHTKHPSSNISDTDLLRINTVTLLTAYCADAVDSFPGRDPDSPHRDRHAGHGDGLESPLQGPAAGETQGVCPGRGRRHDLHAGTPGPVHTHTEVGRSSCLSS